MTHILTSNPLQLAALLASGMLLHDCNLILLRNQFIMCMSNAITHAELAIALHCLAEGCNCAGAALRKRMFQRLHSFRMYGSESYLKHLKEAMDRLKIEVEVSPHDRCTEIFP